MKLIVVRHGETEENVAGIVQGHLPGKLTETGKRQAAKLAGVLKHYKFDYIYSSDLQRCRDTAEFIQATQPTTPVNFTPALREIGCGIYQGKPSHQVDWDALDGNFYTRKPEGGESSLELSRRVIDFINSLYKKHPSANILLITHGGPMRVLESSINGTDLEELRERTIDNTAVWRFFINRELEPAREFKKTVLFVPGFQENLHSRDYRKVLALFKSQGYAVKFIPINWQRTLPMDWLAELNKTYEKYESTQVVLAGFSFGALIALLAATERNPSELWLFSLSPYFAEDLSELKSSWLKHIGKRRTENFKGLKFKELVSRVKAPTLLFAGELEIKKWPLVGKRMDEAVAQVKNGRGLVVPGCEHDITDPKYLAAIKNNI